MQWLLFSVILHIWAFKFHIQTKFADIVAADDLCYCIHAEGFISESHIRDRIDREIRRRAQDEHKEVDATINEMI